MGNIFSNQIGSGADIIQNDVDKYYQLCMDSGVCKDCYNKQTWNKVHSKLKNTVLPAISEDELNKLKQNIGSTDNANSCSKDGLCNSLADFYSKKIELSVLIKNHIHQIANNINHTNNKNKNKNVCNKHDNNCVDKINKLNVLLSKLCTEDIKTTYVDGNSIKNKVIYDKPATIKDLDDIKHDLNIILSGK